MKVIITDKLFQEAPDSSIHMGALIDSDLSPIPEFSETVDKVLSEFEDDSEVSKARLAVEIAELVSENYKASGVLVIVGSSKSSSVAAVAIGEVMKDADVKFEMYKLLGWDR